MKYFYFFQWTLLCIYVIKYRTIFKKLVDDSKSNVFWNVIFIFYVLRTFMKSSKNVLLIALRTFEKNSFVLKKYATHVEILSIFFRVFFLIEARKLPIPWACIRKYGIMVEKDSKTIPANWFLLRPGAAGSETSFVYFL